MKKILIQLSLLIFLFCTVNAQDYIFETINFKEHKGLHKLEDSSLYEESAVIIIDHRYMQVLNEYGKYFTYSTIHRIVKTNDDAGIERFNKVYIPISGNEELIDLLVRTIDTTGQEKGFDIKNLKELDNVDGFRNYKIFAVEGLVKGGELEFTYTIKSGTGYSGREVFQKDILIKNAKLELIYPPEFTYSTKSYNGFPESTKISNGLRIIATDIPALPEEDYSSYTSKLMRVDYKVEINPNKTNVLSWQQMSRNLFHSVATDEGQAQAQKFVKELNLDGKTEFEKIVALEKKIKENFTIKEGNNSEYGDVKFIFKDYIGNERGIIKMYSKCLECLKIKFYIVFTGSRFYGSIDPAYAHYMDLRTVLFYFPETQKYLSPTFSYLRVGPAPSVIAGNNALFLKTTYNQHNKDKLSYFDYFIEKIKYLSANENHIILDAKISLSENLDEAFIEHKETFQGYQAYLLRNIYTTGDEKQKQEFINRTMVSAINDADFKSFNVENEELDLSVDSSKYFICNAEYSSKSIIEKAGNDVLISIGKIIGKQNEMYEEKKRVSDVILQQTKVYNHKIALNIPSGYTCKGLEKLKLSNIISDSDTLLAQFTSDYELANNQLIINITESYNVLELDKSYYNDYRKVINSAADFNKIVLVLEPVN
ncbi:MAG: hypothetical protein A2033_11245 [Bacteroidetes bacterium GWA2_31_9]|nr:MAG: hypothetical protein A2033_11245 [Bacteroidetes bacterium GWA2_31_9]